MKKNKPSHTLFCPTSAAGENATSTHISPSGEVPNLSSFPIELKDKILLSMDDIRSIFNMTRVCKDFNLITQKNGFWKNALTTFFYKPSAESHANNAEYRHMARNEYQEPVKTMLQLKLIEACLNADPKRVDLNFDDRKIYSVFEKFCDQNTFIALVKMAYNVCHDEDTKETLVNSIEECLKNVLGLKDYRREDPLAIYLKKINKLDLDTLREEILNTRTTLANSM